MPELPEVEAVKRVLEPQLQGRRIENVIVRRPEVAAHPAADAFCSRLAGQTISGMARRGKFLMITLVSGDHIVLHLRMTGCLLLTPADRPEEKHTHIVFQLNDGRELRFSDTRRFGRFWLLKDNETDLYSGIDQLGKEPFDPAFSAEYLNAHFGKRKRAIKECLLEQSVIAGIGNIYSDEILFAAKRLMLTWPSRNGTLPPASPSALRLFLPCRRRAHGASTGRDRARPPAGCAGTPPFHAA